MFQIEILANVFVDIQFVYTILLMSNCQVEYTKCLYMVQLTFQLLEALINGSYNIVDADDTCV